MNNYLGRQEGTVNIEPGGSHWRRAENAVEACQMAGKANCSGAFNQSQSCQFPADLQGQFRLSAWFAG